MREKLIRIAASFEPRLTTVFAPDTDEDRHLFELLRQAYVIASGIRLLRVKTGSGSASTHAGMQDRPPGFQF